MLKKMPGGLFCTLCLHDPRHFYTLSYAFGEAYVILMLEAVLIMKKIIRKRLDKIIEENAKTRIPDFAACLLRALQQLCTGVSVGVFSNYGVFLQSQYFSEGGVSQNERRKSGVLWRTWNFFTRYTCWRAHMSRRNFYEMARGLSRCRRAASAALGVTACACRRQPGRQQRAASTILPRPFTISPLKKCRKAQRNRGSAFSLIRGLHLPSDFKKKNGYKRSIELSMNMGCTVRITADVFFKNREKKRRLCRM